MKIRGSFLSIIAFSLFCVSSLSAKTIKEFEAMPRADRSEYIVSFLEKMTSDIGQKNPKLAHDIKEYFVNVPQGKQYPEGLENVYAELAAVKNLAQEGKADLSKVQIEGIVIDVVKQKFPPPAQTAQK